MMQNVPTGDYILIAEDDSFLANVLKLKFTRKGYVCYVANDGVELIKVVREKKPKLILMDLVMPNMDGFETLALIKADPNLKDIKVVVMSNLGQDEDIQKVKDLGAEEYIIKANVDVETIIDKVKGYLS